MIQETLFANVSLQRSVRRVDGAVCFLSLYWTVWGVDAGRRHGLRPTDVYMRDNLQSFTGCVEQSESFTYLYANALEISGSCRFLGDTFGWKGTKHDLHDPRNYGPVPRAMIIGRVRMRVRTLSFIVIQSRGNISCGIMQIWPLHQVQRIK